MVILELLNGVSMDLVTSLCDYSRKQDIKQKNMKYKRHTVLITKCYM